MIVSLPEIGRGRDRAMKPRLLQGGEHLWHITTMHFPGDTFSRLPAPVMQAGKCTVALLLSGMGFSFFRIRTLPPGSHGLPCLSVTSIKLLTTDTAIHA